MWLVATAVLVGWVRGAVRFRDRIALQYLFHFVAGLLLFLSRPVSTQPLGRFRQETILRSLSLLAVSLYFSADVHAYKKLGPRRQMILAGIEHYRADPDNNSPMNDPNLETGFETGTAYIERDTLTKTIRQHLYYFAGKMPLDAEAAPCYGRTENVIASGRPGNHAESR